MLIFTVMLAAQSLLNYPCILQLRTATSQVLPFRGGRHRSRRGFQQAAQIAQLCQSVVKMRQATEPGVWGLHLLAPCGPYLVYGDTIVQV